jgi:serine O-acetyltransferase
VGRINQVSMNKEFLSILYKSHRECPDCPSPEEVTSFFVDILGVLFPDHSHVSFPSEKEFEFYIESLKYHFKKLLITSPENRKVDAKELVNWFFNDLQHIHARLMEDVNAMYSGDPAAKSEREVIRTYPGFYAIAAYRIAHALHLKHVKGIPRVITEHAHSKTGIDIHPGAKIGNHFCIDHGTGVVIGETCVIGNHVKIYQGVTLGALSVNKEDALRKRHPTIEDNTVIYAGATILGGETIIGHDSIIGGNVWITRSVPPSSKIYYQSNESNDLNRDYIVTTKQVS